VTVLGDPGAGKSTFLNALNIDGEFESENMVSVYGRDIKNDVMIVL
jgi:ABC-type molybdenum transport system ATPase subunit/photorepair protein PhrA